MYFSSDEANSNSGTGGSKAFDRRSFPLSFSLLPSVVKGILLLFERQRSPLLTTYSLATEM